MENSTSNENKVLFFACSGASNTGFLADQVSRRLMKEGCGKMFCLAAIGAAENGYLEKASNADNIIVDGCNVACGRKIFNKMNLDNYSHYVLTDYGVEKGKTEITDSVIEESAQSIKDKMNE